MACSNLSKVYKNILYIYIGHTALALKLGLQVFSYTGATTTGRLLGPTICLPHKDGGVPLSALPKDTTRKLASLFSTLSLFAERQAGKLWIPFFKVFWYDSTWEMNPRSTDCEVDALTTTPSRRYFIDTVVYLLITNLYICVHPLLQFFLISTQSLNFINYSHNADLPTNKLRL